MAVLLISVVLIVLMLVLLESVALAKGEVPKRGPAALSVVESKPRAAAPKRPIFPPEFNATGWVVASNAQCQGPVEMTGFSLSATSRLNAVRLAWLESACSGQAREHEWMAGYDNHSTFDIDYASQVCFTGKTSPALESSAFGFWVEPLAKASYAGRTQIPILHQYCDNWIFKNRAGPTWTYCANEHGNVIPVTVPQPWSLPVHFPLKIIFEPLRVGMQPASTFHIPSYCL